MLTNEKELLLELCKFNSLDIDKITELLQCDLNYTYLLGKILMNRVGGIAYYSLRKLDDGVIKKINREFLNTLKSIYEYNMMLGNNYLNNVEFVCTVLNGADVGYSVLKGAYLSKIYPIGLRTSNDVDILLSEKDITTVSKTLKNNGFMQGYINNNVFREASRREIVNSRINRGETVPFVLRRDGGYIEVDLNFSLDAQPDDTKLVQQMLKNINSVSNSSLRIVDKEDFFIHLCVHLYKEASGMFWVKRNSDLSLYKFIDIYYFLCQFPSVSEVMSLASRVVRMNLQKECYFSLFNTRMIFNIKSKLLDDLIQTIKPDELEYMNEIYDYEEKKSYQYDISFMQWLFCEDKENYLNEIGTDE